MIPYMMYFKPFEMPPPPEGVHDCGRRYHCRICGEYFEHSITAFSGGYLMESDEREGEGRLETHAMRHEVAGDKIPDV
jgi:hypothetical protein